MITLAEVTDGERLGVAKLPKGLITAHSKFPQRSAAAELMPA
jgi:hypothetical protein